MITCMPHCANFFIQLKVQQQQNTGRPNPKALFVPLTFLHFLYLLPSPSLVCHFLGACNVRGDTLHIPSLTLWIVNSQGHYYLLIWWGWISKLNLKKSNHLNHTAQETGAVVEVGTQVCRALSPGCVTSPSSTHLVLYHWSSRHPQSMTLVGTTSSGACLCHFGCSYVCGRSQD